MVVSFFEGRANHPCQVSAMHFHLQLALTEAIEEFMFYVHVYLTSCVSFQARTPQQWDASGGKVTKSPPCLGGSRETVTDKAHKGSYMDNTCHSVDIATDTR